MEIENNIQNVTQEDTIPAESQTQQESQPVNTPNTAPQDLGDASDDTVRDAEKTVVGIREKQTEEAFLTIRYNHENRRLSRDETIRAAQKGIRYGDLSDKLDRLAVIKGVTADELIDGMISAERETYKNSLTERFSDDSDTVERLMKLYDIEQGEKYSKAIADREADTKKQEETLNSRLTTEFTALKAEFPKLSVYNDLPESVRRSAENGTDLMSAYLLYRYREEKKISAAISAAETAKAASAGSMSGEAESESPEIKEFKAGLWR